MSPPHYIYYSLLLPTIGLQVHMSSRPSDSYSTTSHHVPTLPHLLFLTTTNCMSTCQHVVKTLRFLRLPQVIMSPPSHMSSTLLLLTTGLHVNTSTNPSESYSTTGQHVHTSPHILFSTTTYYRSTGQHVVKTLKIIPYYRSLCPHLTIYIILYYYLPQVYRSTRRQNPQNHTSTTGHHVMSPPRHISYFLRLHVCRSTRRQNPRNHTSTTGQHVPTSPHLLFSTTNYYRSTGQHVVKIPRIILYCRSPRPHLATSLILYYYQQEVYMSTYCQNPQNHTITTGHHVPT